MPKRSGRLEQPREAEVEDLDLAIDRDEDVVGLHVPVDDGDVVRDREHVEELIDREEHRVRRELAPARCRALPERRPFQKLHHQERAAVDVDVVVQDADGVRVRDLVGDVPFAQKPSRNVRLARTVPVEDL